MLYLFISNALTGMISELHYANVLTIQPLLLRLIVSEYIISGHLEFSTTVTPLKIWSLNWEELQNLNAVAVD